MVPDKFNMVDMGGIDLITMQGEAAPGLYNKLMAAISNCRYQCLYNWLFDGILIPPTYVEITTDNDGEVYLNEGISVTSDDVIHIYSVEPAPPDPEIIPLLAEENGMYNVPAGKDGFNPVTVDVPSYTPVINSITITENGTYNAPAGVDGYSPITVNVPGQSSFVTPDYQGLSYAYVSTSGHFFQSNDGNIYYMGCYHVEQGKEYCLFVGSVTSDRNRCAFYSGKTVDDFIEYIENSGPSETIYNPTVAISPLQEPAVNIRYTFTAPSDGEIVYVTSRSSVQAIPYCVNL